jgi:hypothetical protein
LVKSVWTKAGVEVTCEAYNTPGTTWSKAMGKKVSMSQQEGDCRGLGRTPRGSHAAESPLCPSICLHIKMSPISLSVREFNVPDRVKASMAALFGANSVTFFADATVCARLGYCCSKPVKPDRELSLPSSAVRFIMFCAETPRANAAGASNLYMLISKTRTDVKEMNCSGRVLKQEREVREQVGYLLEDESPCLSYAIDPRPRCRPRLSPSAAKLMASVHVVEHSDAESIKRKWFYQAPRMI